MTDQRHINAPQTVLVPLRYEGVARALRGSYNEPVRSMPCDMERLLNKLR